MKPVEDKLIELMDILDELFDLEDQIKWLETYNPILNSTPANLIMSGNIETVLKNLRSL